MVPSFSKMVLKKTVTLGYIPVTKSAQSSNVFVDTTTCAAAYSSMHTITDLFIPPTAASTSSYNIVDDTIAGWAIC